MTTKKNSIWVEERIPVLERCSIDRASELLHCKVEDLINLADSGAISFFRNIPRTKAQVSLITDLELCDYAITTLKKQKNKTISTNLGFPYSYFFDISEEINISKRHVAYIDFEAQVSGWWQIAPLNSYLAADGRIINPNRFRETSSKDGIRVAHVKLAYDMDIPSAEIYIYREDIEALFKSKNTGIPLTSYNIKTDDIDDLEHEKNQVRITTRQSTMIITLLSALGISEEDMRGSTSKMEAKLRNLASQRGIELPDIDLKTWREWLSREGKR